MVREKVALSEMGAKYRKDHANRVEAVERGMRKAAHAGLPIVASATPVDRGRARAGWQVVFRDGGADLFNTVPYIGILEAGSRPHWPPYDPILRWVVRKKGINLEGGQRHFESYNQVPWRTHQFAKAVQKTIAEEGTDPHWMVRDNLGRLRTQARRIVDRELRNI